MTEVRRQAAIMFTDIAGYTTLMGSDEKRAFDILNKNREIHLNSIAKYNGTLIKEMGDGMLLSFLSSSEAVRCAIDIQQSCQEQQIILRIGIHEGENIFSGTDVFGDGVNIASRLQAEAKEGSIYVSESIYKNIKNKSDIRTGYIQDKLFKNVDEPVKIYEILYKENAVEEKSPDVGQKSKKPILKVSTILISIISVMVIFFILFLSKINTDPSPEIEKSIAVLPFDNESSDERNTYFVNGMMEDIRNNLARIGDLRVISKTSTEKYRNSQLTIKDIARELDVNFLLEGTVQKEENQVKIHAQLIDTKSDDHIWVETYLRDLEDIFSVQSEIAEAIANELYAVITPQEQEIIEKIPTTNISSYDIFLQARDLHNQFWLDYNKRYVLDEAILLYRRALEYDSTFARAYTGLALAYWNKYYWEKYFDENFLDSVMVLTNKALVYDNLLDEAYYVRGMCYSNLKNGADQALKDYNNALKINPNYAQVYNEKSNVYAWVFGDFVEAIKNRQMAVKIDQSSFLPVFLRRLGDLYSAVGFGDMAREYYREALLLNNDSSSYYNSMIYQYLSEENILTAYQTSLKCFTLDSSRIENVVPLIFFTSILNENELAYQYSLKLIELFKEYHMVTPNDWHRIGYTLWKLGKIDEANYYFNEQIKWAIESIKLNRTYGRLYFAHYDLACIYVIRGEIDKAFEYLNEINKKPFIPQWWISQFNIDPFFITIRDDERFQKLLIDFSTKYQREHDRVKVWLEEDI